MARRLIDWYWIAFTAALTFAVWLHLFPTLLERCGLLKAIGLSLILTLAMGSH